MFYLLIAGTRKCKKCDCVKALKEFPKDGFDNNGHKRRSFSCLCCKNIYDISRRQKNKEKSKEYFYKYYREHKKERSEYNRQYSRDNKIKRQLYKKKYREDPKNRRKRNLWEKNNRDSNPRIKINLLMSTSVRKSIKDKNSRSWVELVDYSLEELMSHLESKFRDGMTWQNHGKVWHIDHIKPKSLFCFESKNDPEFKKCWALENLQPLLVKENLIKGNRFEE